jgi:hypothetical protein
MQIVRIYIVLTRFILLNTYAKNLPDLIYKYSGKSRGPGESLVMTAYSSLVESTRFLTPWSSGS